MRASKPTPRRLFRRSRFLGRRGSMVCVLWVFLSASVFSSERGERFINVPEGNAHASIPQVAQQSGVDVVFDPRIATGVHTPRIFGWYTAQAALDKLLKDTRLMAILDEEAIAFAVVRKSDLNRNPGPKVESVSKPTTNKETISKCHLIQQALRFSLPSPRLLLRDSRTLRLQSG